MKEIPIVLAQLLSHLPTHIFRRAVMRYRGNYKVKGFTCHNKQHQRIRGFVGTSPNDVKTQIWIGITTYVLVAVAKNDRAFRRASTQFYRS